MQNIRAAVVCFCARIRCSVWFYVMKQRMCGTPVPVHQIICPSYSPRVTQTWQLPYLLFLWVRQQCSLMCALWAYTVSASSCRCLCLCVGSRWTVHPHCCCHLYYLRGCDMNVPQGMGTKEELCKPPPRRRGPPISLSGRHLLRLWPRSSLEILLPEDSWREGSCCKSDSRRLSGEKSAGCGHFWSPVLLSDCTTMGGTGWMCTGLWCSVCVRPYAGSL